MFKKKKIIFEDFQNLEMSTAQKISKVFSEDSVHKFNGCIFLDNSCPLSRQSLGSNPTKC